MPTGEKHPAANYLHYTTWKIQIPLCPYGIAFISEHYEWCMAEAFSSLTGLQCFVNDIAMYCSDLHQHASHVMQFLQQCTNKQIAYNFATLAGLK